MAKSSGISFDSLFFLQLALGAFFIALGVLGLSSYGSRGSEILRFFGRNDTLNLIMSAVELCAGAVLLLGLFVRVDGGLARIITIALFALWIIYIALTLVLENFLKPTFSVWIYNLAWNSVILVSIRVVGRKYMT